ncbi:hypothetical protein COJ00_26975 [Priestia megaterium]|uniref:HEPN domain-containing protein n=1 Tax=Priestia megaterium TaxID=1404 RepID=UPI000BF52947|nr:HEPN domain-containing protein [Priestia megaterium]PFJ40177.1 hypothetical protein COJ00_26975 [Priestia megaterium]
MNYNKAFTMVKDLLDRVEYGEIEVKKGEGYEKFGTGDSAVTFQGAENLRALSDTVEYLWTEDRDLFDTISRSKLQNKLANFIRRCIQNDEFSLESFKEIFEDLKSDPVHSFEVLYPVYGFEYHSAQPLEIGPYTIYNVEIHEKELLNKYSSDGKETIESELGYLREKSNMLISVREKAREIKRADQKARIRLRQFEDTIRFIIGNTNNNYDVGIFNFNAFKAMGGLALSHELIGSVGSSSGTIDKVLLNKFPINNPRYGYDRIWEILNKENPTQLEQRIISAITWIGKGLRDEEPARSLVQYVFALEALLQFQQKNSMVSPSITYQMAEFATFIIAENLEDRFGIEKTVKKIYTKRSAIAHGGSHTVDGSILLEAYHLVKSLIIILITNGIFKDFKTIDDISEWVRKEKYSSNTGE